MRHTAAIAVLAATACIIAGAAAAPAQADEANLLLNGTMEQGKGDQPSAWSAVSVPAERLRMWRATDLHFVHSGQAGLAILNEHDYPQLVSNNWAQAVQDIPLGQAIRLTVWIRTEDADNANVCVQCVDMEGKEILAFSSTPVLRGTNSWTELHSEPIVVPKDTGSIIVRAALTGKGMAVFDDLSLEIVSLPDAPARALFDVFEQDLNGSVLRAVPIAKDCMILKYFPDWNLGNLDNVGVANNDGGVRELIAWDNAAIKPAEIESSETRFVLALYAKKVADFSPAGELDAYMILADWPERTSWNTQPKSQPFLVVEPFVPKKGWKFFDVTAVVRQKARDGRGHGIMLRFKDEDKAGGVRDGSEVKRAWAGYTFVSREAIGEWAGFRPMLLVMGPKQPHIEVESSAPGEHGGLLLPYLPPEKTAAAPQTAAPPAELAAPMGKIVEAIPVTKDCMILAYLPDWSRGDVDNVGLANYKGGVRALFAWGPIPPNLTAEGDARFILSAYSRETIAGESPGRLGAYVVEALWPELTSWETQPKTADTPAATFDFAQGDGWKYFDVTDVVRSLAKEGREGFGVELRFLDETRSVERGQRSDYGFVSREGAGDWEKYRPMLLVVEPEDSAARPESTDAR